MKNAGQWRDELRDLQPGPGIEIVEGRGGEPTLKAGNVYLHSRYRPREEAARLIDSAGLDRDRPVLVVGLGLGYHVRELIERGAEVAAVEPNPAVAKCALEGPLKHADILIGLGDADAITATDAFKAFASKMPQLLVHAPSARIAAGFSGEISRRAARCALGSQRLRIAVVGPMYGGSLPIAGYLQRAFQNLGHTALLADNSAAWDLYSSATEGVKTKQAAGQLGAMLTQFLNEWSYARVAEFAPDICVVVAQAPVGPQFPVRLAKEGVVTAFWFVENWRHMGYWQEIAPYYDYFFHIQPGEFEDKLDEAGCVRHAYVQTGCDPDIHKPVELAPEEQAEFGCDISFAGAGYYNRVCMFRGLTDFKFKLWGVDWNAPELARVVCRPDERFTPELFARIVAGSKINLNLHSSAYHDGVDPACDAINPRVFEIAACGGFQLCDPCIGLDAVFDFETELPVYRNLNELRDRIAYFLAHRDERKAIAHHARERALRDHTYERRAQQMLDLIIEGCGARILQKGVRVQRTVSEVADRVGRDTPLGQYLASLPPDTLFTHENINAQLTSARTALTHPEKVFIYLREVRSFAETLFGI